jgi:hypothetical protein
MVEAGLASNAAAARSDVRRDGVRLIGVVIIEAPSLIQARLKAAVSGVDGVAPFAKGHGRGGRCQLLSSAIHSKIDTHANPRAAGWLASTR